MILGLDNQTKFVEMSGGRCLKDIIIFDGAFGTYYTGLYGREEYPESANIRHPERVQGIHREYIASGANAIKTNTFAANPATISDFELLRETVKSGYHIAMAAASESVRVFADIGPIVSEDAAADYLTVAKIFLDEGASCFLFETLSEISALEPTIQYIKENIPNATIITSFAVTQDGYTRSGEYYQTLFRKADAMGADYVGLNCICGPAHMLNLISKTDTEQYAVIAMPNAGYPSVINGRTVYVDNPAYFSHKLYDIYCCGVQAIGGCCGTTPRHIKETVERIRTDDGNREKTVHQATERAVAQTSFSSKSGYPIIAVEIGAPVDTDIGFVLEAAHTIKRAGADFITIPDSPLAKTRANSMMIAAKIQREADIAVIPHVCCRDRNQIAIKGDLIAGSIEGVRHILAITGDPISQTDRDFAKNVFGFNSYQLIHFIHELNAEVFAQAPYHICAALNSGSANFTAELNRAKEKRLNGADCFFTQPLFSEQNIENYRLAKKTLDCPVMAGIMPLAGYRNALFLNNEVPGIDIPEEIITKLADKTGEASKQVCLSYSRSIIDRVAEDCDGYYIMTPLKKIDFSEELIRYINEKIR